MFCMVCGRRSSKEEASWPWRFVQSASSFAGCDPPHARNVGPSFSLLLLLHSKQQRMYVVGGNVTPTPNHEASNLQKHTVVVPGVHTESPPPPPLSRLSPSLCQRLKLVPVSRHDKKKILSTCCGGGLPTAFAAAPLPRACCCGGFTTVSRNARWEGIRRDGQQLLRRPNALVLAQSEHSSSSH